ncbi:MAG: saccharopine dehydrogenase NADP-binding domain-containing protein [Planctomycetia bacterium]|nr:MAG: saccharopine dehydrogenase NADP-binding domain-containing protein [Planctomycetia bacterium]
MRYRYCVIGAGRQGVALAHDLLLNCEASRVVLADADETAARRSVLRLVALHPSRGGDLVPMRCDAADAASVQRAAADAQVVISAAPYRFNEGLTRAAIAARAHFCDLGGNTSVVRAQLSLHESARAAGVSVLPDCGLAPGLGNILAADGVSRLEPPIGVQVRCGGLPQRREGPLAYKLVFNFDGLVNEYSGFGEFLRDGAPISIPTLTELEAIEFPEPIGRCEAAVTSGGTSTCAESFAGRVQNFDYKTVRYPGHFAVIRAMFGLGLFDESVRTSDGGELRPRALTRRLFEERLALPEVRDLVVLRVTVRGRSGGIARRVTYDLHDLHDERTGFTAMERTTAFPTALVAYFQARGMIPAGARPLEQVLPTAAYVKELGGHDIRVSERDGPDGA